MVIFMKGSHMFLSFGLEEIYVDASFQLETMDKVGVVGVNGAGKTTLFRVILQEVNLEKGSLSYDRKKRVGYLPQEIVLEDLERSVLDYLLQARPILKLEQDLTALYEAVAVATGREQERLLKQIGETQELLEYYDCYNAETVLFRILEDMKIDLDLLDLRLKDLSGGQKSKIAFAHLLYANPEILLLDEPTNHLDLETRDYITNYLKEYQGMVLIISHDVAFLNAIIQKTLYLNKVTHQLKVYEGNYDSYLKKMKQEQEAREHLIEKQEKEEEKLRAIVLQYSNSSGKRKRMAQSREKLLEKKRQSYIERETAYKRVHFTLTPNREGSKIPLKVNNLSFHYPNQDFLYQNLSFILSNQEKFLIVGENGVGKSTLLKLIVGKLKPEEGSIWFGNKTDLAYYAQELEILDPEQSILKNMEKRGYSEKELRTMLGSFLFFGDDVFKLVKVLSPGEKARVALCKVLLERPNLLLLDEPTNHLDPETQTLIAENFKEYPGSIILVSHNVAFASHIGINRILLLPSGKIMNYDESILTKYQSLNEPR